MISQLMGFIPPPPEVYWDLAVALVFAVLVDQFVRRVPRLIVPRIKALDLTNPPVLFVMQIIASLTAIAICRALGLV
ncbi:hypothetical protein [Streptomyces broussonetiae]|uniref:YggT family protein n=1 Tax=Streptomyces broussonetiae TaxID=2686304 RepID=A0ABV5EHG8_9ACTN